MKYKIIGDNLQIANVSIKEGEVINAEAGAMVYKSGNVNLNVESKGIGAAFKRMLVGESLFLAKLTSVGGAGLAGFGGKFPGKIVSWDLKAGESVMAEKGAYLCSDNSVEINAKFVKRLGAGLLGGEGLLMQELKGPGTVLLHACGDLIEYNLKAGERIDISTRHLVAFDPAVDYDLRRAGNIKTTVFGGEGLFLAQMTGPGRVVIQSMTKEIFQPQQSKGSSNRGGKGLIGSIANNI